MATGILAGSPPINILAVEYSKLYHARRRLLSQSDHLAPVVLSSRLKNQYLDMESNILNHWLSFLTRDSLPSSLLRAIFSEEDILYCWINRNFDYLSFRIIQVLTGHGCFANFVHRIGRTSSPSCLFCGFPTDDVTHVLNSCPAFISQRRLLALEMDNDLTLRGLILYMLKDELGMEGCCFLL